MSTAIYPGSFNPWTKGHQDILDRALEIFDNVIIVIAKNPEKTNVPHDFIQRTLLPIAEKYNGKVSVTTHRGLVSKFKLPIVRGVRSGDWEYEQNLAVWNKELGVDTIFFCPRPENSHISSSALRQLNKECKDITKYAGNEESIEIWLSKYKIKPTELLIIDDLY